MKQRLFTKYFLTTAFLVLISLTVMLMILTVVYNNYLADYKYETLSKTCESVSAFAESENGGIKDRASAKGTYYIMRNLAEVSDLDLYITDNEGIIRICSCDEWNIDGNCEHTGTRVDGNFIRNSVSENAKGLYTLGIYTKPHYVCSATVKVDGAAVGVVIAAAPLSAVKELMIKVSKIYALSAVLPICIMFIALYVITYRTTKPLKLMSQAANAMAKGDFSRRIPVTRDDEIGQLAVSFNQMTNNLARMESMRKSFIADVSHELKTPMTTIAGFIDGIIDGTIEPEKQEYYLNIVSKEVKRLSRMVESMLGLSRLESDEFALKYEKFDFRELLLSVVIGQEQRIEKKNITINGLDSIESVTVNADKDLIYRVIYNLVDNAVKFTNENGKIDFSLLVDSKRMTFEIKNTGRGIPQKDLPFVFERFYKVDKSRSANKNSTGLGLYMVKTIISKHNGTVTVNGKEGEFASFTVKLPL